MDECPTCHRPYGEAYIPPEPPLGTWVRDRFGCLSYHQVPHGWGEPGISPLGEWEAMWKARGPLVECATWGQD